MIDLNNPVVLWLNQCVSTSAIAFSLVLSPARADDGDEPARRDECAGLAGERGARFLEALRAAPERQWRPRGCGRRRGQRRARRRRAAAVADESLAECARRLDGALAGGAARAARAVAARHHQQRAPHAQAAGAQPAALRARRREQPARTAATRREHCARPAFLCLYRLLLYICSTGIHCNVCCRRE